MSLPLNDSVIGHTFEIMRGAITPWQDAFYSFLFYLLLLHVSEFTLRLCKTFTQIKYKFWTQ